MRYLVFASALLLAACQTTPPRDLARTPGLYTSTGYHAKHHQDRSVWILPVGDRRQPLPTHRDGVYPLTYTEDRYWARPIAVMVDEVVRKEIADAGLFARIAPDEASADWVIEPTLLDFYGAVEERVAGRRVLGKTRLHVKVWGKRGKDGRREVLREQTYNAPTETAGAMFVPDPHALAVAACRKAVVLMLLDLEAGGRLFDGIPAEAAFDPTRRVPWPGASR